MTLHKEEGKETKSETLSAYKDNVILINGRFLAQTISYTKAS